jgi:hypothetical protein
VCIGMLGVYGGVYKWCLYGVYSMYKKCGVYKYIGAYAAMNGVYKGYINSYVI